MTDDLDAAALIRIAANYLARYAASTLRLRRVLERHVRRWHAKRDLPIPDGSAALVDEVVSRVLAAGLLDDHAFAVSKARSLVRRGWPERRIRSELGAAGLDVRAPDVDLVLEGDDLTQAHRYAARKRLGPHRARDRASFRDKDVRSLMRAGFSHRTALAAVDAERDETAADRL